jgi:thioredoxin-like negative regulator of GroEL
MYPNSFVVDDLQFGKCSGRSDMTALLACGLVAYLLFSLSHSHPAYNPIPHAAGMFSAVSGRISKAEKNPVKIGGETEQSVSEADKQSNHKKLEDFLGSHDKCIVMVYAPWCSHCKTALPGFKAMAAESSIPTCMVNGDSLPVSSLTGPSALIQVEYFPTFCAKNGEESSVSASLEKATEAVSEKVTEAAAGVALMAEEENTDVFADLF